MLIRYGRTRRVAFLRMTFRSKWTGRRSNGKADLERGVELLTMSDGRANRAAFQQVIESHDGGRKMIFYVESPYITFPFTSDCTGKGLAAAAVRRQK